MKKNYLFILSILFIQTSFSQISFLERVISDDSLIAGSAFAADLDGDGDLDVLSSSFGDNTIAWYENTDGLGNFGVKQIINDNAEGARRVTAADFDGDGDMDVLSAAAVGNKVSWYENTDGLGTFNSEQVISSGVGPQSLSVIDIDNDGDLDIVVAFPLIDTVAWFENTDGLGSFGTQNIISTNIEAVFGIFSSDIDGDGDFDVVSAALHGNKISWFENTNGLGNFGPEQIITTLVDAPNSLFAIDIDKDGDIDLLSSSHGDDKIAWYENLDGLGSFGTQLIISSDALGARYVFADDIDNDGDIDVFSASEEDNKFSWYENLDGLGSFGIQQIITTDAEIARTIITGDIDNDGDKDLICSSRGDHTVSWFENDLLSLSLNNFDTPVFSLYPNPATNLITLKGDFEIKNVSIYDLKGRLIQSLEFENRLENYQMDINALSSGLYIINVKTENAEQVLKFIKE